jgi:hypothetical protein
MGASRSGQSQFVRQRRLAPTADGARRLYHMSASKSIVPFGNWFDKVRVRATPLTETIGLAGRTGQVYGETVPSTSGVGRDEIIGELIEDYAVNVHFDELKKDVWFTRDLLEFVDHAPGSQITISGTTRIRTATGEWIETDEERP